MTVFADGRFDKLNDLLEDKLVTVIMTNTLHVEFVDCW